MNTSAINQVASTATESTTNTTKKTKVSGKTVGNPQLSEKAAKYYEELKKKFGNMDFILVSSDKKEEAESNAMKYANPTKTVVLIDDEKIEKMAEDEEYRAKFESVIKAAGENLSEMKSKLDTSTGVTGYGFKINDNGTASYFAVIDKSLVAQKERIEKAAEKKAEDKKTAAKKAEKEERAEQLEKTKEFKASDQITVTASSLEELMQKINDTYMSIRSDNVLSEQETYVGQHFDMSM